MTCVQYLSVLCFFVSFLQAVLSHCGVEINNASYPLNSAIFDGSIDGCACKDEKSCIRKCCGVNYVLEDLTCISTTTGKYENKLKLPVYHNGKVIEEELADEAFFVPGMIDCGKGKVERVTVTEDLYAEYAFDIQKDGSISMPSITWLFDSHQYCLDFSQDLQLIAYLCYDNYVEDLNFADRLSFVGVSISLPFLLATFIVYALLPQRTLHGKSLMCYVMTLFGAFFMIVLGYFLQRGATITFCRFMGMFAYYCFLASIFWMNVMSYDISTTFSGRRGYSGSRKREDTKRFIIYCAYAWGMPLLFVTLILTLSQTVKSNAWYDPGVRGEECFLRDGYPELIYFYLPLSILITANIVMFILTAWRIKKIQNETAALMRSGSQKHSDRDDQQNFQLYIRLLFAMGLNWSVEIINWAVNWKVPNVPAAIWYVTDFFNAAYGVLIFFIFVFKKKIWKDLKKRFSKDQRKNRSTEMSPKVSSEGSSTNNKK